MELKQSVNVLYSEADEVIEISSQESEDVLSPERELDHSSDESDPSWVPASSGEDSPTEEEEYDDEKEDIPLPVAKEIAKLCMEQVIENVKNWKVTRRVCKKDIQREMSLMIADLYKLEL